MTLSSKPGVRILYVGGYVRSGTTIVDMLLGMNTATFAVGEINIFFQQVTRTNDPAKCSCGHTLRECPFWSEVLARFQAALPDISLHQANLITRKVETFPERLRDASHYWDDYVKIWRVMIDAVAEISGASIIVDSSKTGRHSLCRPLSLEQAGFDVSLLQMMRDPRAVTWSKLRREIGKGRLHGRLPILAAAAFSGFHWSLTNLSTGWRYGDQKTLPYYELHYEEFIDDPVGKLREIEQAFQLDLSRTIEVIETDAEVENGHLSSGNELRMQSALHLRKLPPTWKTALPPSAKLGVLVSAPAAHHYHYHVTDYR